MTEKPELQNTIRELISEYLMFAPDTGQIRLFDQRMLLIQGMALSELRRELIERIGLTSVRSLLTRIGYQRGINYYQKIQDITGNNPDIIAGLGLRLGELEGFVHNIPIESMTIDTEKGIFFGDYQWQSSWEAEAHLNQFGISSSPTCWMMTGYASGYSTAIFGRPVLWREVECTAMGHKNCRVIGKPLDQWDDPEELGSFLQAEPFVDLPRTRKSSASTINPSDNTDSPLNELVGASAGFNRVIHLLKKVAPTDTTVLLLGESGVGKERFSKALHAISKRAALPCISVNCAAIPSELVESELFGVEKGAFTGAASTRPGRFERANGGTLFLDEIGSLPFSAQGKLLRALQEGEIERVGGTNVIPVSVRIVAAANHDLRQEVKEGRFRADLFYRLNVYPIEIPPLRERQEDIALLLNVFIERYSHKSEKKLGGITRRALDALWHYDWPGNVRELENLVERAVILAEENEAIDVHHLFSGGETIQGHSFAINAQGQLDLKNNPALPRDTDATNQLLEGLLDQEISLGELEKLLVDRALQRTKGNISAAARLLKMGRGQIQYRLSKES